MYMQLQNARTYNWLILQVITKTYHALIQKQATVWSSILPIGSIWCKTLSFPRTTLLLRSLIPHPHAVLKSKICYRFALYRANHHGLQTGQLPKRLQKILDGFRSLNNNRIARRSRDRLSDKVELRLLIRKRTINAMCSFGVKITPQFNVRHRMYVAVPFGLHISQQNRMFRPHLLKRALGCQGMRVRWWFQSSSI